MEFINAVGGVTGNVASPYSLQSAPLSLLDNVASSRNVTGEGWGDVWVKVCADGRVAACLFALQLYVF